jgi:hypothetical protein
MAAFFTAKVFFDDRIIRLEGADIYDASTLSDSHCWSNTGERKDAFGRP